MSFWQLDDAIPGTNPDRDPHGETDPHCAGRTDTRRDKAEGSITQIADDGDNVQRADVGAHARVLQAARDGDDAQVVAAGAGSTVRQEGGGGDNMQRAYAGRDSVVRQRTGDGNDVQVTTAGHGATITQDGGGGDNVQVTNGGTTVHQAVRGGGCNRQTAVGAQDIRQCGSPLGTNTQFAVGDARRDVTIVQRGGILARNTESAQGGHGDDTITMVGGWLSDHFAYVVTPGQDVVTIDGGPGFGTDAATILGGNEAFRIIDRSGQVLYQQGEAGTTINIRHLDRLVVTGPDGQPVWQWERKHGGRFSSPPA